MSLISDREDEACWLSVLCCGRTTGLWLAKNSMPGTYEIESERRGYALEIAVDFVRMQRDIEPFWIKPTKPLKDIEPQTLKEVEAEWPKGEVKVRMNDYMFRPHQKWSITPVGKGGYLGGPL